MRDPSHRFSHLTRESWSPIRASLASLSVRRCLQGGSSSGGGGVVVSDNFTGRVMSNPPASPVPTVTTPAEASEPQISLITPKQSQLATPVFVLRKSALSAVHFVSSRGASAPHARDPDSSRAGGYGPNPEVGHAVR